LDITRRLQMMALPTELELRDKHPSLDLAGYMQSAERVGGDLYDALCAEGRLIFAVGDVTDHGLESGVVMLQTMAAGRALFEAGKNISQMREPAHYLTALNRTVCGLTRRLDNDKNLTYAIIDYQRAESGGILTICGQHEEVLICRADGRIERVDTQDLGFPLGLIDDIDEMVSTRELEVQCGDVVLLYTDGVTEAENQTGQLYGSERLVASLQACSHLLTATEVCAALIADLHAFMQGATVQDDISLFAIKHR
jgi:serine phosphatase RsbU (regulator of sigma subunit)